MKSTAFALALLISGTAFAQIDVTAEQTAYEGDLVATTAFETEGGSSGAYSAPTLAEAGPVTAGAVVEPGNSAPERDARGIPVISAAAVVPAGWNGTAAGAAMGGPELDPATGEPAAPRSYPACTASVTDHCLQTYERGRR
ncbi:MAG TPA: hypothetical protein VF547_06310 [Allosphingosinicella sp.]|jgi:hypothetical protein